jgi:hypothetical protein
MSERVGEAGSPPAVSPVQEYMRVLAGSQGGRGTRGQGRRQCGSGSGSGSGSESSCDEGEGEMDCHSQVESGALIDALQAQAARLCVAAVDVVSCVPGPNKDGDAFWLLRADGPAHQLDEAQLIDGVAFDAGSWVASGTWFEWRRDKFAAAREYVLGSPGAVSSHLVFSTACGMYLVSEAIPWRGVPAASELDIHEEGCLFFGCAANMCPPS